jgi:F-type H+-transporting ATPase subunit gamma
MANLKELRRRITSVGNTMKITSAMKMVSAAKLKKAQDAIQNMRPYSTKLSEILSNVSATLSVDENPFAQQREVKKVLLVLLTSNRGLCGPFNSSVIKRGYARMEELIGVDVEVMTIGKKAFDLYKRTGKIVEQEFEIWNSLNREGNEAIANTLMDGFTEGRWDRIEVIYNQFRNAAVQVVQLEQFLPIQLGESKAASTEYLYEPIKEKILEDLVPIALRTQLYKALLDSMASEHGARMTAMHKATDNATDLRNALKLQYNQARQAAITNEILEIVSGANALEG